MRSTLKGKDKIAAKLGAVHKTSLYRKRNIYLYSDEDIAKFLDIKIENLRELVSKGELDPSDLGSVMKQKIKRNKGEKGPIS